MDPQFYNCQGCGHRIGRLLTMAMLGVQHRLADELCLLVIGDTIVEQVRAICPKCGSRIYFNVSEQKLDRLIQQVTERAK